MSLSADTTATVVGELQWLSERLAALARTSSDTRLQSVATMFDRHAALWAHELPESVLLEPERRVRPANDTSAAAVEPPATDAGLVAHVGSLAAKLAAELATVRAATGEVADGSLRRTIDEVDLDLDHVRRRLGVDEAPGGTEFAASLTLLSPVTHAE